jgi:uncharacterized protein (DUF2126 family)
VIPSELEEDLRRHDEALTKLGLRVWVGGEPTFTDRFDGSAEWRVGALGGEKEQRAERFLARMAGRMVGGAVLRTEGRRYPGEDAPRWSKGVYARRDAAPVWHGPPDPCAGGSACTAEGIASLRAALVRHLAERGMDFAVLGDDDTPDVPDTEPETGAGEVRAFVVGAHGETGVARVSLPAFDDVSAFIEALAVVGDAANRAELPGLVLAGASPPADASVWWTTVTPDPGVIEVNLAPASSALDFARDLDVVYGDASDAETAAYCLRFNGDVADSGGGGHITLGGPSLEQSPFALHPQLLPRLIAYFVRHPSLSYLFSDHAGSSSQAPRVDETSRESLEELALALHVLERTPERSLETTWRSLAPFLTDRFGNTHRCEINVEKLCNPYLPGRGRLGVVELRALRMPEDPCRWGALAALFRAIVARLAVADASIDITRWTARELHDRLALPFFQRADLRDILADLETHGVGLGPTLVDNLLRDPHRVMADVPLSGCSIEIRRATEFWPLVGDLASQDGTSRLVDPSCRRIEVLIRTEGSPDDWSVAVERQRVRPARAADERGEVLVLGVRSREFVPNIALHPLIPARETLELLLGHPRHGARRITLHAWRPGGGAYDGLPASHQDADERRRERVVVAEADPGELAALPDASPSAVSEYSVDVRWLPVRDASPDPA